MKTQRIIVGSYASTNVESIYNFNLDLATGQLQAVGVTSGIENPSFLVKHPELPVVYATGEIGATSNIMDKDGRVHAFGRADTAGPLVALNQVSSRGALPCHLALDRTARWLFASNYGPGSIALFSLESDGAIGELSELVQLNGSGVHKRQDSSHAHSVTISPCNRFAYVADLGADEIVRFRFDARLGTLVSEVDGVTKTRPGSGPRHAAFNKTGEVLYVLHELDCTLGVFSVNPNGDLQEVQTLSTLVEPDHDTIASDVVVSQDDRYVYATNRGADGIAIFEVDMDGRLRRLSVRSSGGSCPRTMTLTADGSWAVVANQESGYVSVLPVHADGMLGPSVLDQLTPGAAPACVHSVAMVHSDRSK